MSTTLDVQGSGEVINVSPRRFPTAIPAPRLILAVGFPLVLVALGPDGTVTITCRRHQMLPGVRISVPMVVAEELEADWGRVRVLQADGNAVRFGNQDTHGARGARHFFEPMRRCGAAARTMLEQAAAIRWQVPFGEVEASNHEVVHRPTRRWLAYGALAAAASRLPVPARDTLRLKAPAQFRYIGKEDARIA
jgi:isoquinoline 1-oxidoreductase beta subunit